MQLSFAVSRQIFICSFPTLQTGSAKLFFVTHAYQGIAKMVPGSLLFCHAIPLAESAYLPLKKMGSLFCLNRAGWHILFDDLRYGWGSGIDIQKMDDPGSFLLKVG